MFFFDVIFYRIPSSILYFSFIMEGAKYTTKIHRFYNYKFIIYLYWLMHFRINLLFHFVFIATKNNQNRMRAPLYFGKLFFTKLPIKNSDLSVGKDEPPVYWYKKKKRE